MRNIPLCLALIAGLLATPAMGREDDRAGFASDVQAQPQNLSDEAREGELACVDLSATVKALAVALEEKYVIPAKGQRAAMLLASDIAAGRFTEVCGDEQVQARFLNELAQDVLRDGHLVVYYDTGQSREAPAEPDPDYLAANLGFDEISRMPDGIAYIRVSSWGPSHWTVKRLPYVFALLQHTNGIIIDLRGNRGGDGATTNYFVRSFLPENNPMSLVTTDREGNLHDFDHPEPAWPRIAETPLAVLIDGGSASASEAAAFSLREEGRARIFGTRSSGAGHHLISTVALPGGFIVFVPELRDVGRISGESWEGVGVTPDVYADGQEALLEAWSYLRSLR